MLAKTRASMLAPTIQMVLKRSGASMPASHTKASGERSAAAVCLFGKKHFGRPLSKLVVEDPSYCRWILRKAQEEDAPPALQDHAAWLRSNAAHVEVASRQASGGSSARMQQGRDLSALAVEDPVYCQWILREAKDKDASPEILANANWLLKNAPHLKEQGLLVIGGKYRGKPMSELAAEDPSYCQWILRESQAPNASHGMKAMGGWVLQNMPHLKEQVPFASGRRNRGRLLSDVLTDDPGYCQWVLEVAKEDDCSRSLQEQAAWLLANAPQMKEVPIVSLRRSVHTSFPLPQVVAEDPRWCRFILLRQSEAFSAGFVQAAEWLRENASELLDMEDETAYQLGQTFFKCYGRHFLVRYGKHRMKTFEAVVKESPKFVEWAERQSASADGASKNLEFLVAFARQSKEASAALSPGPAEAEACKTAERLAA